MAAAIRADSFEIDCAFYIAGPPEFVAALVRELSAAGVPEERLHSEVTA